MSTNGNNLPTIFVPQSMMLPDNQQWTNRFEVHSESSSRVYIISQNIAKRHWGCSCPGWRTRRNCKHLEAVGVPSHERPYEVQISSGRS